MIRRKNIDQSEVQNQKYRDGIISHQQIQSAVPAVEKGPKAKTPCRPIQNVPSGNSTSHYYYIIHRRTTHCYNIMIATMILCFMMMYYMKWIQDILYYSSQRGDEGHIFKNYYMRNRPHDPKHSTAWDDTEASFHEGMDCCCTKVPLENIEPIDLFSGEATRYTNQKCHDATTTTSTKDEDQKHRYGKRKFVELVVAYCQEDLEWMYKDVIDVILAYDAAGSIDIGITIMSKCGKESWVPDFVAHDSRITNVTIIPLANVGGCDFAYAHFINRYIAERFIVTGAAHYNDTVASTDVAVATAHMERLEAQHSTVILFMKGSLRSPENFHFPHHERFRGIDEILNLAVKGEFGCGLKTACDVSPYHDTSTLNRFTIQAYSRITDMKHNGGKHVQEEGMNALQYKNLGDFHRRALNWTFPNEELTLVCYGGTFAIPAENILSFVKQDEDHIRILQNLERALARGSKVAIEEHFAERTWAGMFANPLSVDHTQIVKSFQKSIIKRRFSIFGPLQGHRNTTCLQKGE